MEYTTNDLAKILDVSTNTIRRFGEKGYLEASRDENNGYRQFAHSDVERLMYVEKYRKLGFGHGDIAEILQSDRKDTLQRFQGRMDELDAQIAHLTAMRHLLKDDLALIKRVDEYGPDMIEMDCSPMHYVLYQKRGKLCTGGRQGEAFHRFMSTCPEMEYIYLFEKADVEAGNFVWSEGVAANQLITGKYNVNVDAPVESYERHPSVLRFIRLPLNFMDEEHISRKDLKKVLFDDFFDYIRERDYALAGDVIGLKICYSREQDREWQYVLMHFPVDKV